MIDLLLSALFVEPPQQRAIQPASEEMVVVCWKKTISNLLDQCARIPASKVDTFIPPEEAFVMNSYGLYALLDRRGGGVQKAYQIVARTRAHVPVDDAPRIADD